MCHGNEEEVDRKDVIVIHLIFDNLRGLHTIIDKFMIANQVKTDLVHITYEVAFTFSIWTP